MISVIIATKNRPSHVVTCLKSLFKSSFKHFEIILIDQSDNDQTKHIVSIVSQKIIRYFKFNSTGKTKALNYGISQAQYNILAFTDDDCIVHPTWLTHAVQSFSLHKNIDAVFGKTLPYQASLHNHQICPCTFTNTSQSIITQPCAHYKYIGFGNNMIIRKSLFNKIGNFKTWLGPGSIGSNGEDAEYSLRILTQGKLILYNPKLVIYHNKWLTYKEMRKQQLSYMCGEMACYGYFHFQKFSFATAIVSESIEDTVCKIKTVVKYLLSFKWQQISVQTLLQLCTDTVYQTRGLLIGFIYSVIDPI